ncbi:MAG: hypothetical protein LUH10_06215 [Tannerellaceae bacterium]|nr:hypothetical protein [Tannerellaceae bacterium]
MKKYYKPMKDNPEKIKEPEISYFPIQNSDTSRRSSLNTSKQPYPSTIPIIQRLAEESLQQYKEGKYRSHEEMEKKHPL